MGGLQKNSEEMGGYKIFQIFIEKQIIGLSHLFEDFIFSAWDQAQSTGLDE